MKTTLFYNSTSFNVMSGLNSTAFRWSIGLRQSDTHEAY